VQRDQAKSQRLTSEYRGTILTGCTQRETEFILRIPLNPNDLPFQFKRLQFLFKVCFAITINKSQGQTLKFSGIDLRENFF